MTTMSKKWSAVRLATEAAVSEKIEVQIRQHLFSGSDPVSTLSLMAEFTDASSHKRV